MITASPPGKRAGAVVATAALGVAALVLPAQAASAADGSAPPPVEYRVLADIHTDAVSTFLDDGQLTLATKADVAEGNHTRFEADEVWFHVDDDAKMTWPAGFEFVAAEGAEVWLAPEVQNYATLWPGFSTESVPAGTFDGNTTTLTLVDVAGPGDVELWTSGIFGGANRIWSSDEDLKVQTLNANQHKHANWAFTAPGTYEITIRADATIGGEPQNDTATYTFVVGDLPEQVATTTTIELAATDAVVGQSIGVTASVSPAHVEGFIEFHDGSTVLGHEPVVEGSAQAAYSFPIGARDISATFVPSIANLANPSSSSAVAVTVTDGSGEPFGIRGVAASYAVGGTLEAFVVGHTLTDGETYRWSWRPVGATTAYVLTGVGGQESAGRLTLPLDMSHDGYEIRASLRAGGKTIANTEWVALEVTPSVAALTPTFPSEPIFLGDQIEVTLDGSAAEPDSVRLAYRFDSGPWYSAESITTVLDAQTLQLKPTNALSGVSWVAQTIRDGVVVGQSQPVAASISAREAIVSGLRSVYRVGQMITADATVFPALDGLAYKWELQRVVFDGTNIQFETEILSEGSDASSLHVEFPARMSHNDWTLTFSASTPEDHPSGPVSVAYFSTGLTVSDADASTQLFFFESLGDHYHQGGSIALDLVADPALTEDDTISWEWQWPGGEWITMPGADGMSRAVTAEQALDGVQVRAILGFGDETLATEPVTIHVDDHGSPARQVVTVTGEKVIGEHAVFAAGESGSFTADVAHGTVLDTYQWYVKPSGADEFSAIDGATSVAYDFTAATDQNGAQVRVAVTKPDGSVVYGPSAPISVTVKGTEDPGSGTEDPGSGTGKPTTAPTARTGEDLGSTPAGGIGTSSSALTRGQHLTIELGADHANDWVAVWMFSTPTLLAGDWMLASGTGSVSVIIPADAPLGDHRIAVFAADGSLIGWAAVTVAADGATLTGLSDTGGTFVPVWMALPIAAILGGTLLVLLNRRRRSEA